MTDPFVPRNPDWEAEVRDSFARQPVMAAFSCRIAELTPGRCVLEMPFDRRWTQQTGVLQAGIPAVIGDSAGGFAALSLMPPDSEVLAVEFKVNFLAPAAGDVIRAVAQVIKPGRTLTILQVDVHGCSTEGEPAAVHAARLQQTAIRVDKRRG